MNEHDKLFKEIESDKENAIDLIEAIFPRDVLCELILDTLTIDTNSYVDKKLKEYYTDLVYNCKSMNNVEIKISLLFEHKSYKPDNEYLQLLRYITNIWSYQEKNKQNLTLIIPVIFYHGEENWKYRPITNFFKDYNKKLYRFLPGFDYVITDICQYDDNKIKNELVKRDINKALFMLFKYINNEALLVEKLYEIFLELKNYIDKEEEQNKILSIITYIMELTEISPEQLTEIMKRISLSKGEVVMTTAMKLRLEGKLEGEKEGKKEGRIEAAKKMFELGSNMDFVMKVTNLSEQELLELSRKYCTN